jgi:hypothetical protein
VPVFHELELEVVMISTTVRLGFRRCNRFQIGATNMRTRRELLGALGIGTATLALLPTASSKAEHALDDSDAKNAAMRHSCCDSCSECATACNKAYHYCLDKAASGQPRHAKIAQVLADCAAFCDLSATLISRQSTLMAFSCRACADACRQCGQDCASFDTELDVKMCFDACQRCEESCRNMVKAMGVAS